MDLHEIRQSIRDVAGRPKNVTLAEIERIVEHLGRNGFTVRSRTAGEHAVIFHVKDEVFSVCTHNRGSKQLKPCYVRAFLKAMIEVDLYE